VVVVTWLGSSDMCLVVFVIGFPFYLVSDGIKKREANAENGVDQQ